MIRAALLASAFAFSTLAYPQAQPAHKFEPEVGQPGKDVVWVPTPQAVVDKMLDTAKVTPNDFVMDLGSGDGRTVITMFLLPEINKKLRPEILKLKPGTRVVSNTFTMGEWQPDETYTLEANQGCESSWCTVLFWIVPAQVAGTYKTSQGEFTLNQDFQMLKGVLKAGGRTMPIEGKVRGEEITITNGAKTWKAKKNGSSLELL